MLTIPVIGRETWGVCPQNGSYIAGEILNDQKLSKDWFEEVSICHQRMISIRNKFCDLLEEKTKRAGNSFANKKECLHSQDLMLNKLITLVKKVYFYHIMDVFQFLH